ncbi:hypothetical protein QI814_003809 [Escherichia coli]|nr:hypothetical protein [Escherichia coli]
MTVSRNEKIIMIYPTVVRPGLVISHFMPPDPIVLVQEYPASFSFYLTALMYFEHGKRYTTELDVLCDGESVMADSDHDDNTMETFMFSPIDQASVVVGTSLLIQNVTLKRSGTYDIIFKLYEEVEGKLGNMIDEKTSGLISSLIIRN